MNRTISPLNRLSDPQYWRGRAEQARRHAVETTDLETQSLWLRLAEGHERQAALSERAQADEKGK
jgi:hypothetical protein